MVLYFDAKMQIFLSNHTCQISAAIIKPLPLSLQHSSFLFKFSLAPSHSYELYFSFIIVHSLLVYIHSMKIWFIFSLSPWHKIHIPGPTCPRLCILSHVKMELFCISMGKALSCWKGCVFIFFVLFYSSINMEKEKVILIPYLTSIILLDQIWIENGCITAPDLTTIISWYNKQHLHSYDVSCFWTN